VSPGSPTAAPPTPAAAPGTRRRLLAGASALALATLAAPVLAQTRDRRAPLLDAILRDDAQDVRTALLRGADADRPDDEGTPPLVLAAREQAWNAARALAELRGTALDATNRQGANALMYAALHGRLDFVRFLISRRAEVNKTGWTALHFAAANGHADVVRLLLEEHAYVDAESPNGTTPLMMAARNGHPTVVRLLVEEGADPTPRNEAGLGAADYARLAGDPALAGWLAEREDAFRRRHAPAPGTVGR